MKRSDEPTVVSLESHRRRRQAESRKKPPARRNVRPVPPSASERAINWRRVPIFAGVLVLFFVLSWLLNLAGKGLPLH